MDRTARWKVEIFTDTRRIEHDCRSAEEANRVAATLKQIPEIMKIVLIETVGLENNPKFISKALFSREVQSQLFERTTDGGAQWPD